MGFRKVFTLLLAISVSLVCDTVRFSNSWGPQGFSVGSTTKGGMSLVYSINEFTIGQKTLDGEINTTIQLPGVFLQNDAGAPDLPGSGRNIAVPQFSKASYRITDIRSETYKNINLAPAPVIPKDTDRQPLKYEKNESIYSSDSFYPESFVKTSELFKIRGLDVVTLGITPFQYNPVTKELVVYRDIKIEVTFEGGNGKFGEDRLRNRYWDRILKNSIINPSVLDEVEYINRTGTRTEDYEYIIICPDDATFISYANQLKEFRTKQGIKTGVVTTTEIGGNTQAAIEGYIDNAYNNWDVPPSGVLMLGDYGASGSAGTLYCPTWDSYCVSDNFYADVDETDGKGLPEIAFARMTAQNETHLQTMISKIINYETNPPTALSFYDNPITALGWQTERWFQICSESIGGFLKNNFGKNPVRINAVYEGYPDTDPWSTATNTDQVLAYFGPSGRGYIPSSPSELGGWTGGNAADVITAINSGAFILQHRDHGAEYGWGEPDFQSPNISSLTNINNQLPFVFSMNCLTGKFNYSGDSFAELFHRYSYNGINSGCLGILAATESSYSFVNDTYAWGMYDYFYPSFMPDYGSAATDNDEFLPAFASVSGKIFLDYSNWPYNTESKEVTNYLFHVHGDPFMVVYTEVPQDLTVSYSDLIDGDPVFYVTADTGSVIALVANGEIIGESVGTGSQQAISIVPQFSSTQVILTVTKQNYFRYENIITVQQPSGTAGGTYSQSVSSLDFGNVTLGNSLTHYFSITNSHTTEFITGQIVSPSGYTVSAYSKGEEPVKDEESKNSINYTVPANTTRTYSLKFEPESAISYNSDLTISSSDNLHSNEVITLTGAGVVSDINLNHVSLSATTAPESSINKQFDIQNTDIGTLDYSMTINYTSKVNKASGGPDTFGYKWKDSDEADGPVYDWVDITGSGTIVTLTDDSESSAITMGMTFPFYGLDYTTVVIADNGAVTFTGGDVSATNATIPTSAAPNALVSPFWDDLNCGSTSSGDVYYYYDSTNSRFVIEYYNIVGYGTTDTNTFEILLYENGKIVFQYDTMNGDLAGCTVGIESPDGTDGSLVTYNSAYLKNSLVIEFQATPEWLSLDSNSGSIVGVGNDTINATCDATGLEVGTYSADIIIASNDPDESTVILPVTFNVAYGETGGTFALNQSSLSYGNVGVGQSSVKQFTITNSHASEYLMGNITTIDGFTVATSAKEEAKNVLSYTVSPSSSKTFDLAFAPSASQTYSGNVTITSTDDAHLTEYISVSGTGTEPTFGIPFSENFNASTNLPTSWTIVDHQGNGQVWEFGTGGSMIGADGNYAYLDSDGYGSGNTQNTDLVTPKIDMSNAADITLSFDHYFNFYSAETATLSYSIDGGTNWTQIQQWSSDTSNPESFNQAIPALDGQSNVKLKWNYTGSWGFYWSVDDILITGTITQLEAPGNITVVSATSSEVNLDWDDVAGATMYHIYRSTDPYSGFAEIGTSGTNSYQDTGVSAGNKYFYYITADNAKERE